METIEIKSHSLEIDDVVKHFLSSLEMGISEEEANNRINKYGLNELVQTRKQFLPIVKT